MTYHPEGHYVINTPLSAELEEKYEDFGYVFVTKDLLDHKKVRFMYREELDEDDDSGWRFFSGDETQAYVDNPKNLLKDDVRNILQQDILIEPLLDSPVGSAWEREGAEGEFVKSEEFKFEPEE